MMDNVELAAWLADRCGALTASRMGDAMSFLKNGQPSAARTKYMHDLLAERLTGLSVRHYVNDAMEFGLENEDAAAHFFEEVTGRKLKPSWLYEHPTILNFKATPDRELDDGLVEIKVPTSTTFVEWVLADVVPECHKPQLIAQLVVTGKQWTGFVAFDPRVRDQRRRLFMRKFIPTQEERDAVEKAAITFLDELDELFDKFVTAKEAA